MLCRNEFIQLTNIKSSVVATVDHPYTSPPIHLFDAHDYLLKAFGGDILIINWDVSIPGERTYRYDLITDTGLIAKLPFLFHYRVGEAYCSQEFDFHPWELLQLYVEYAVELIAKKYYLSNVVIQQIFDRAMAVIDLTQKSYNPTPWLYTKNLLFNFYNFIGRLDLRDFIAKQYLNYWSSAIVVEWIPWCMENITGQLSIKNLLSNNFFIREPFRNAKVLDVLGNLDVIIAQIRKGVIIPSFDVFLWSLAVAGIKHYGNDFNFFRRLSTFTTTPEIARLQITSPGEDARRFLTLSDDYAVLFSGNSIIKPVVSHCAYQKSKSTRINSFFALYVIGGQLTIDRLQNYNRKTTCEERISLF